jgi:alpha-tubulin suppressor-like RCC1 family protein
VGVRSLVFLLLLVSACRCPGGGTSSTPSTVRVEPGRLAFGERYVGTASRLTVTLTNTGRAPVIVGAATQAPFGVVPAEVEVGGGDSVLLTVSFSPGEPGAVEGALTLTGAEQRLVALEGTGLAVPSCPPAPTCARARFDTGAGRCVVEQEPDGATCTNACLADPRCVQGECRGAVAASCDDQNACTVDSCSADGRCVHEARECAVSGPCVAAWCDPAAGCGERPLDDGAPCGEPTCRQSPICLGGQCVLRDNPGAADVCVAVDLAAAYNSTCVLTRAGTVRCWGNGFATSHLPFGQQRLFSRVTTIPRAGQPTSLSMNFSAVGPPAGPPVTACTTLAGGGFECFGPVVDAGLVAEVHQTPQAGTCWRTPAGVVACLPPLCRQLDGGPGPCGPPLSSMPVGAETGVLGLFAGTDTFCAVRGDGGVVCWGHVRLLATEPAAGADGGTDGGADAGPFGRVELVRSRPVRRFPLGRNMSCAVYDDGAECRWYRDDSPTLTLPAQVVDVLPSSALLDFDALAVLRDGGLDRCRDVNDAFVCAPLTDAGLPPVTRVATGLGHACFLTRAGEVGCVGLNDSAQLSDLSGAPPSVSRVPGVQAALLATAVSGATVPGLGVVQPDGGVAAWGNFFIGSNGPQLPTALPLPAADVRDLVVNHAGGCVVRRDGGVTCLDEGVVRHFVLPFPMERFTSCRSTLNEWWQNAIGAGFRCSLPLDGGSLPGVREPFCDLLEATNEVCVELFGSRATCLAQLDGGVRCRGTNRNGHLGTGNALPVSGDRVIAGVGPVEKLALSFSQACALERGGRVQCWGRDVASGTVSPPRPLPAVLPFARDLTCGDNHCCVLVGENGVSCWGANTYNELGRDVPASDLPVAVPFNRRVEQLAAYGSTTCARLRDGEVWCWGDNRKAQRGWEPLRGTTTPVWVNQ